MTEETPPKSLPEKAIQVPPQMVAEIATGLEEPLVIARRYGFTDDEFGALAQWPPFLNEVERLKAQYKASGKTFKIMSGLMAEDLAQDLFVIARASGASFSQKLSALEYFTKVADLMPKAGAAVSTGPAFSITIDLSGESTRMAKPAELRTDEEVEDARIVLPIGQEPAKESAKEPAAE